MMLRDCSRLHGQLTADKLRLTNQVREILWRYYPQFLEIYSDLSRLWVLELWMLAPTPHKAKHLRLSSIERLLKKHRIRCIDAKTVKQCLTAPSVAVAAATTQGAVFQLKSVIERLTVVIRQLKETQREMDRLIDEYDKSFREQDDPEAIHSLLPSSSPLFDMTCGIIAGVLRSVPYNPFLDIVSKYTPDRGHRHAALRSVADRLLKVACVMLKNLV